MDTVESAKLLAVASEPGELRAVLGRCRRVERLRWPVWFARRGELNGVPAVFVANGAGPEAAAAAVRVAVERSRPEAVLSTGYCGALDPQLAAGDIVVALRVEARGTTYAGAVPEGARPAYMGTLVSVGHLVRTTAEKAALGGRGAAAVDMEAGAVAFEACRNRMKFYCVRAVLDRAHEGFEIDFDRLRDAKGRYDRVRIVKTALRRPRVCLPELLRLYRRTALAGRALGEFLGTCKF